MNQFPKPLLTKEQLAQFFKVPVSQIQKQYEDNLRGLQEMQSKARATGKRVNNYTLEQLNEKVAYFDHLVKSPR